MVLGIEKAPIVLDLYSQFSRVLIGLRETALGKGQMVGVIIVNPLRNIDDTLSPNALTVMYGDGNGQILELLPGASSPIVYAKDLEKVYARVQAEVVGVNTLWLPLLIYKQR